MNSTFKKSIELDTQELQAAYRFITDLATSGWPIVIAGGAPRDILLDKPVKDYDIFFPTHAGPVSVARAGAAITSQLQAQGITDYEIDGSYHEAPGVLFTVTAGRLQFIAHSENQKAPSELVATFDMGICQAWMEPNPDSDGFEIHASKAFDLCVEHKVLGESCHTSRVGHLLEKYPEYLAVTEIPILNESVLQPIPF